MPRRAHRRNSPADEGRPRCDRRDSRLDHFRRRPQALPNGWQGRARPHVFDIIRTRALQLKEVTLADAEVVRFLSACESEGIHLQHCLAYIREWIVRERESAIKG